MSRLQQKGIAGSERGAIVKKWTDKTPVCVAFPNTYYVGMSNLAVHLLYRELNNRPDVVCERVFLTPGKNPLRWKAVSLWTPSRSFFLRSPSK